MSAAPLTAEQQDYYEHALVGMALAFWAKRQPDAIAVVDPDGTEFTFAEINAAVNRVARLLRSRGLGEGDAIAVAISNRHQFVWAYYAALRVGLRFTPVNFHLTADEMAYIVDDCDAKAFIADHRVAEAAAAAGPQAPRASVRLSVAGPIDGFEPLEELIADLDGSDIERPALGRWMLYTSGTTGRPKGVVRPRIPPSVDAMTAASNRPGEVSAEMMRRVGIPDMGIIPGVSRHLTTGPLYHAGPLNVSLTVPFNAGVGVVLMDEWSAELTLELIQKYRITHSHMVPTMFHRLLQLPDDVKAKYDVSSLKYIWHGAAHCPVAVKRGIIEWWGPVLLEYYAASEGSVTYVSSEDWLTHPGTVGRPVPEDLIKILDADGNPVPQGEAGTIYVKIPPVGQFTYYKSPEKTSGSYRGDYYTLGDIGYLDKDNYLFLTDRSADLIISGGVNIYPAEIEAALLTHPSVGDVAVIGIPNAEWGESVIAVVEPKAGVSTDGLEQALIEHSRQHLAKFKVPRRIDFTDSLPRTESGKLAKAGLREEYRARAASEASEQQGATS